VGLPRGDCWVRRDQGRRADWLPDFGAGKPERGHGPLRPLGRSEQLLSRYSELRQGRGALVRLRGTLGQVPNPRRHQLRVSRARARRSQNVIDLKLYRQDPDAFSRALLRRQDPALAAVADRLGALDRQWRSALAEVERLKA